jgi:Cdc6-like AAA superfamily ATPase
MARSKSGAGSPDSPRVIQLPRDALKKVRLGTSFAEYDDTLTKPGVFVQTPATLSAEDATRQKYFFIGRRGTGKTATSIHLVENDHHAVQVHPGIFSPSVQYFDVDQFSDPRQKPFKSLVSAFRSALQEEVVAQWFRCCGASDQHLAPAVRSFADKARSEDFDTRVISHVGDLLGTLDTKNDSLWLKQINEPKSRVKDLESCRYAAGHTHTLVLDRLDEFWDGSDIAVTYLTALMHAALQMNTQEPWSRVLVFLRENIFERVRAYDPEFSRLETSVVGMDWTQEQLIELVERRMNLPFSTRIAIGGATWDYFFEKSAYSRQEIFNFCQNRPRDVLIYCEFAIESAVSHLSERIRIEDIHSARRRFSDSRLKDLGDEYSENFPHVDVVLSRFYGLGRRLTLRAIEDLLAQLLDDEEVQRLCASWIYQIATPESLVRLLYSVGFLGLVKGGTAQFRSSGPRDTTPPPISAASHLEIHPSYWDALDLQDKLVVELDSTRPFLRVGMVADLPEAMTWSEYQDALLELDERLAAIDPGTDQAADFEGVVGDIIRLCFHRYLTNLEQRVRDVEGRVVRDWIASNRADGGFWEVVRQRYDATQIVFECKNYAELGSSDFHQIAYYLGSEIGRFGILIFRGRFENGVIPKHYIEHVKRIATDKNAMVLLLVDDDLRVFIRQSINGKIKDAHIQDKYDRMVRAVS